MHTEHENVEHEYDEQLEATNKMLLDMIKNQKTSMERFCKVFVVTVGCFMLVLVSMVVGFFIYESQFETVDAVTTETAITQEVSGEDSTINNVSGNQYNDNAVHNGQ